MNKICVSGYWYSGSGAVVDWLSGFEDSFVLPNNSQNLPEFNAYKLGWIDEIYNQIPDITDKKKDLLIKHIENNFLPNIFANQSTLDQGVIESIFSITTAYLIEVKKILLTVNSLSKVSLIRETSVWLDQLASLSGHKMCIFDQAIAPYSNPEFWLNAFKDTKFIFVERNPFDQITDIQTHSTFFWIVRTGGSILEFLRQQESDRKKLRNLQKQFPEKIQVVRFEDMVLDHETVAKQLKSFLKISDITEKSSQFFKPEVSEKNIGKYESFLNKKEISLIDDYCRENNYLYTFKDF